MADTNKLTVSGRSPCEAPKTGQDSSVSSVVLSVLYGVCYYPAGSDTPVYCEGGNWLRVPIDIILLRYFETLTDFICYNGMTKYDKWFLGLTSIHN